MEKKYYYFIWAIIPVILFIFSFSLRKAQGEYFLNGLYDPSYPYLIGSLNLAQLSGTFLIEHPGIPVQVIGAVVIRICYLFIGKNSDIAADVLSNPELYLNAINLTLILINCIFIFLMGIILYKYIKNVYICIFLQTTPLVSGTIYYRLSSVSTEIFLIPVIIALITFTIVYIYENHNKKNKYYFITIFAVICGIGIATKITFLPLILIPLILLDTYKQKIVFLIFTFISSIIFIFPAISSYSYFLSWIYKLTLNDGKYGQGNPDVVEISNVSVNLKNIFLKNIYFTFVYISILATILINFKRKDFDNVESKKYKLLIGIFISATILILMITKHYSEHYMLQATMFLNISIYLILSVSSEKLKNVFNYFRTNRIITIFIFVTVIQFVYFGISWIQWHSSRKDEAIKVNDYIKDNYQDATLIASHGSSSDKYALAYSIRYAGYQKGNYFNYLNKIFSNEQLIFYDVGYQFIFIPNLDDLKKEGLSGKIIYQSRKKESDKEEHSVIEKKLQEITNSNNVELVNVFSNSIGESVYEIKLNY